MKVSKFIVYVALFIIVSVFAGCEEKQIETFDSDLIQNDELSSLSSNSINSALPYQESRYDYAYLNSGLNIANQYLKENSLSLDDLRAIHDIANIIFGDYRSFLTLHFDDRTENIMDDSLFDSEYSKIAMYTPIMLDLKHEDDVRDAPYIHIFLSHIGERGKYIFVPISVYSASTTNDVWRYFVLQIQRTNKNKYGWSILYNDMRIKDIVTGEYSEGPWTIKLNEDDDFSISGWGPYMDEHRLKMWDFYSGKLKENPYEKISHVTTRSVMYNQYDRQSAASYSYNYALTYNTNYCYWSNDCANFASQCLYAGGLPQNTNWNYSYNSSDPMSSGTSSWRGASNLYHYLLDSSNGSKVPIQYMIDTYNGTGWCSMRWGDLVFMNWASDANIQYSSNYPLIRHVMVVTHSFYNTNQYYNGIPRWTLSGHTTDTRDEDINNIGLTYLQNHAIGVKIDY